VDAGISTEDWNVFLRRWEVFRAGSGIDAASAPAQLFQCAGGALGDRLLKSDPDAASRTLPELLQAMRALAVIPVAVSVLRTELLQLNQGRGEQFRSFAARVRGKAETCSCHMSCSCSRNVDYTDNVIRDVLLCGMSELDIRRETLGTKDILEISVNDVIALAENKEIARNAFPLSAVSAASSFKRQGGGALSPSTATSPNMERSRQAPCPVCKKLYHLFSEGARGWNKKPHQVCIECHRARRREQRAAPAASSPAAQAVELNPVSQIATLRASKRRRRRSRSTNNAVTLDHHILPAGEWRRARLRSHPTIPIRISMDQSPHAKPGRVPDTSATVLAVADTGAQSDLWSLSDFLAHGFSRNDLSPVTLGLAAANRSPITIEGAFFAKIETTSRCGEVAMCRSMVYVSSAVQTM